MSEKKVCSTCNIERSEDQFTLQGAANGKRRSQCRFCERDRKLAYHYNLTPEEFRAILAAQCYTCAVCHEPFNKHNAPHVDHDHSCCPGRMGCGKCNRGLLCSRCNRLLGMVNDDQDILERAVEYLNREIL